MRKLSFLVLLAFLVIKANTQVVIAEWTFEDAAKRAIVDQSGNPSDYTPDQGAGVLSLQGGPTLNLSNGSYFASGSGGTGTFAINSKGWDDGVLTKYWQVVVSTTNLVNIKVSSKQRSSNTGPKDFKLQYSLDGTTWTDVPNAVLTVTANFDASGSLNQVPLPNECNNKQTLYLRWVVTSTISVNNSTVASTGTNRIDDILIEGSAATTYPVTFGVEGTNGNLKAFVETLEIQSGANVSEGSDILFKAIPQKGFKVNQWKLNDVVIPGNTSLTYLHQNLQSATDVKVSFTTATSPTLDRYADTLLMNAPEDINIQITWNDATQIDSIVAWYGTDDAYVFVEGVDYAVTGNVLTIFVENKDKFSSKDMLVLFDVPLTIIFDIGMDQIFTVSIASLLFEVNYSVAQGQGTIVGYAYNPQSGDYEEFASGSTIVSAYGVDFYASPAQDYKIKKWTVNGQDLLNDQNELDTSEIIHLNTFNENLDVAVYFIKKSSLNNYSSAFQISPNPAIDYIRIDADGLHKLTITDIRGVKVLETSMLQNSQNIDIRNLRQGLYIVNLSSDSQILSQKFIKK